MGSKALMSGEWSWIVMSMDMEVDLSLLRYCVFVIFIWENPRSHYDVPVSQNACVLRLSFSASVVMHDPP